MTFWFVTGTSTGFEIEAAPEEASVLDGGNVLAVYATLPEAERAIRRARLIRDVAWEAYEADLHEVRQTRTSAQASSPEWATALQLEAALCNTIIALVQEVVRPRLRQTSCQDNRF